MAALQNVQLLCTSPKSTSLSPFFSLKSLGQKLPGMGGGMGWLQGISKKLSGAQKPHDNKHSRKNYNKTTKTTAPIKNSLRAASFLHSSSNMRATAHRRCRSFMSDARDGPENTCKRSSLKHPRTTGAMHASPTGSRYSASMELRLNNHIWYGFRVPIPYWHSHWTL